MSDERNLNARSSFPPRAPLTWPPRPQYFDHQDVKESAQPLLPSYSTGGYNSAPQPLGDPSFEDVVQRLFKTTLLRQKRTVVALLTALLCISALTHRYYASTTTTHEVIEAETTQETKPAPVSTPYMRAPLGGEPPPVPRPPPPKTQWELPQIDKAELPIMSLEGLIQPRKPVPLSWPNPWVEFGERSKAYDLLRGRTDEDEVPIDPRDPPRLNVPPARFLGRAYEWAAEEAQTNNEPVIGSSRTFHPTTGRPLMIESSTLYKDPEWKRPELNLESLPSATNEMPRVQASSWSTKEQELQRYRRLWVKRAFVHAWEGYKLHAWGHDELRPASNSFSDGYNGWGATIVDNLDTLLIMNMSHEYNLARKHIEQLDFTYLAPSGPGVFSTSLPDEKEYFPEPEVRPPKADDDTIDEAAEAAADEGDDDDDDDEAPDEEPDLQKRAPPPFLSSNAYQFASPRTLSWFETLIRYLGGMIAAFDLSQDPVMLQKATELGDWLLPALATRHGLPRNAYSIGHNPKGTHTGRVVLAEAGTLSLELTRLSMISGDPKYFHAAQRAMDTFDQRFNKDEIELPTTPTGWRSRLGALLPAWVDPGNPSVGSGEYTFGGLSDSYYEYLIKQYQLLKGKMDMYSRMHREVIDSVRLFLYRHLEVIPGRQDLGTIGSVRYGRRVTELEHLTCFAGGTFGLGAKLLDRPDDMEYARNITNTCAWLYESTATGCGPETTIFYEADEHTRYQVVDRPDGAGKLRRPHGNPIIGVKSSNPRAIGRPESIESVFYMYRLTGDRSWQDQGWKMFVAWVDKSITASGFAGLNNVHNEMTTLADTQESFVLAETLKYYYLLFSDPDVVSLDEYVLNTEAHPFRIPTNREPAPLWTGPEPDSLDDIPINPGEGTPVQQWFRVQQAAALLRLRPPKPVPAPVVNELANDQQNKPVNQPVGMGHHHVNA